MPFAARQGFFTQPVGGAQLWTPANLPTLTAWYDASDESTITKTSNSVSQWNDKSGNGYNIIADTSGEQPTFVPSAINSESTINFDGTNDLMYNSSFDAAVDNRNPIYIFTLAKRDAASSFASIGGLFKLTNNDWHDIQGATDGSLYVVRRPSDGTFFANTGATTYVNVDFMVSYQYNGTTSNADINGGAQSISFTPSTTNIVLDRIALGGLYRTSKQSFWDGDIHQYLVVAGNVSANDQEKLEGWAAHKYGLTSVLPSGHPYKSSPPYV